MRLTSSLSTAVAVLVILLPATALAHPGFARKYETSCATCHNPFPRLNSVGEAFRLNGYRFPNDEDYRAVDPISLGAPAYKRVWPDAIWPSDLPRNIPLSLSVPFNVRRDSGISSRDGARWDFNFPSNVSLLSGGTLGEDIGFWTSIEIEDGQAEFHRVFFSWNDLFPEGFLGFSLPENAMNLRAGLVEPGFLPWSIHRQLTVTSYLSNTYRVGLSEFMPEPSLRSVEIYGTPGSRFLYWVGLTTGTEEGDTNNEKDVYARLAYKLGGIAFDGTFEGSDEQDDPEAGGPPTLLQERSLELGVFGYVGEPRVLDTTTAQMFDQDIHRVGAYTEIKLDKLNVKTSFMYGEDENAFNDPALENISSTVATVEGSYELYPWVYPAVRYEQLDFEKRNEDELRRFVFSVTALVRANIRTTVEYRVHVDGNRGANNAPDAFILSFWLAY